MSTGPGSAPGAPPLLEVRGLSKSFPLDGGLLGRPRGAVRAVDGVSFQVGFGETLALVGETGSGKSTTALALLRLVEPDAGSLLYRRAPEAEPLELTRLRGRALRAVRRELQIVFQDPYDSLDPRMRVGDIVGEGLAAHGLARGAALRARVARLLERVGLEPSAAERFPHAFSGGQRQRIAIARAIAVEPRLLVCDEALSALDASVQAQVLNLLADLRRELGLAYLFIAHDLALVRWLADRVAVMHLGRIVESAPTEALFARPEHPYTRALLASAPSLERAGMPEPLQGEPPSPSAPPPGCAFHPRCPVAEPRCSVEVPRDVPVGPGHSAACHLARPAPPA